MVCKGLAFAASVCLGLAFLSPQTTAAAESSGFPADAPTYGEVVSLAQAGDPRAQWQLADAYWYGRGVEQNVREAERWYRRAAEAGVAEAQYSMGYIFDAGVGRDSDLEQAVHWYRLAAVQGEPYAQTALADMHTLGYGVPRDEAAAAELYRSAAVTLRRLAANADVTAQSMLGALYYEGRGVEKNLGIAAALYRAAADTGFPPAQHQLGLLYRPYDPNMTIVTGRLPPPSPFPQDTVEAYKWFALAGRAGYLLGIRDRDVMAQRLSDAQRAAADAWVDSWKPSSPVSITIEE
jgi:TPR repeat protein